MATTTTPDAPSSGSATPLAAREGLLPADDAFGFPPEVVRAFEDAADAADAVVLTRAPGAATSPLIAERYDLKGFFIKAKSCDWGPMAGFVCMNPLLNKFGPKHETFNTLRHEEYLWTLDDYQRSTAPFKVPTAHPAGPKPDGAALSYMLGRAFRPLVITDKQKMWVLKRLRAVPGLISDDAQADDGTTTVVGIAVNDRSWPTTAIEFLLQPIAGGLWALRHGNILVRTYSKLDEGSTVIWSADDGKKIVLAPGDGALFPTGSFTVTVRSVAAGTELMKVTRENDSDTLAVVTRGENGTPRLATFKLDDEVHNGAVVGESAGWRVATFATPLLSSVAADANQDQPRDMFRTRYGDAVAQRRLGSQRGSNSEATKLTGARAAFLDRFGSNWAGNPFEPPQDVPFWPTMGAQNPFPPRVGPKSHLNAVTGDYDLAAVWPRRREVEQPRISEIRSQLEPVDWFLLPGTPLFRPVPNRPFAVESVRVPGLYVEFVPTDDEMKAGHLESDVYGNASALILDVVGRLNSLAARRYGQADVRGAESKVAADTRAGAPRLLLQSAADFSPAGTATVSTLGQPITWLRVEHVDTPGNNDPMRMNALVLAEQRGDGRTIGQPLPGDVQVGADVKEVRTDPPNIAFHSDEGGRPDVYAIDLPTGIFLPQSLQATVTGRGFVVGSGDVGSFLDLVGLLQTRCVLCLPGGWVNDFLRHGLPGEPRGRRFMWLLLRGAFDPPPPGSDAARVFVDGWVELLRGGLLQLVSKPVEGTLPAAAERAKQALALRVPQ